MYVSTFHPGILLLVSLLISIAGEYFITGFRDFHFLILFTSPMAATGVVRVPTWTKECRFISQPQSCANIGYLIIQAP
jgi:hypothetical protein